MCNLLDEKTAETYFILLYVFKLPYIYFANPGFTIIK